MLGSGRRRVVAAPLALIAILTIFPLPPTHSDPTTFEDKETFDELERRADNGDADAQYRIGVYLYNTAPVPMNRKIAEHWFTLAVRQGSGAAAYSLARLVAPTSQSTSEDQAKAAKFFERSLELGYPVAQYSKAAGYERGNGRERNLSEAYRWYLKAAEQNYPEAQMALANLYATGRGVARDEAKANKLYQQATETYLEAALKGDGLAQNMLAVIYEVGLGTVKNTTLAGEWFAKSSASKKSAIQREILRDTIDDERDIRAVLVAGLELRYFDRITYNAKK